MLPLQSYQSVTAKQLPKPWFTTGLKASISNCTCPVTKKNTKCYRNNTCRLERLTNKIYYQIISNVIE